MFHNLIKLMSVSYYFVFLLKKNIQEEKFNREKTAKRNNNNLRKR